MRTARLGRLAQILTQTGVRLEEVDIGLRSGELEITARTQNEKRNKQICHRLDKGLHEQPVSWGETRFRLQYQGKSALKLWDEFRLRSECRQETP